MELATSLAPPPPTTLARSTMALPARAERLMLLQGVRARAALGAYAGDLDRVQDLHQRVAELVRSLDDRAPVAPVERPAPEPGPPPFDQDYKAV